MSHQCPYCKGKRTYEVHTRQMIGGVRCGHEITLLYACHACKGRGTLDCLQCEDTGYMPEFDHTTGEYEGEYPCLYCDRGRVAEAQESIDREKAAWEESRPDYIALSHERVAAGLEPW